MDLKQLVYDFKVEGTEEAPEFYINLCTGSSDNLKPELVLESLFGYMNIPYNANAIQIHRLDVYAKRGTNLFPYWIWAKRSHKEVLYE